MATRRMCRSLVDLLQVTRSHANAAVRRTSLFAFSRVVTTLTPTAFQEDYLDEANEMLEWLLQVVREEPDQDSRTLAKLCLSALKDKISETPTIQSSYSNHHGVHRGGRGGPGIEVVGGTQSLGLSNAQDAPKALKFL